MRAIFLGVSILAFTFAGACFAQNPREKPAAAVGTPVRVEGGSYTDITVPELQKMLTRKDFSLVNVHIPFEGNLPSTDSSIPFDEIESHLDKLPAAKDSRIVLYCRSGRMSAIAGEKLARLGYTHVYNLVGGFNAWRSAGLPLAQ